MKSVFHLNSKFKKKIDKILPYVLIGLIFGCVYAFIEKGLLGPLDHYPSSYDPSDGTYNPYDPYGNSINTIIQSGVMGLILGIIEVFILDRIFSKKNFFYKFVFKSVIYISSILIIVASLSIISTSIIKGISLFDPIVYKTLIKFFTNAGFWSIMLYIGVIFSFSIFFSEMSDHMGQGVLRNFLLGKYHKPREEERIFMFMDIKSSTSVAETLGHVNYFRFLNEYYADVTKAIIETKGEIYQYVGDEITISWTLEDGLSNNNCLHCFFMSKTIIHSHAEKYIKEFGIVPVFKIGLHYGHVTTGRIGVVKKEIIFTGDVLNTTARIQSVCNSYSVDNLISNQLLSKLSLLTEFTSNEIGECKLRGKNNFVKLYTINAIITEL
jgi:adenylate cyclase